MVVVSISELLETCRGDEGPNVTGERARTTCFYKSYCLFSERRQDATKGSRASVSVLRRRVGEFNNACSNDNDIKKVSQRANNIFQDRIFFAYISLPSLASHHHLPVHFNAGTASYTEYMANIISVRGIS